MPFGRSVRTVGIFTDGHGRAALALCPGLTRGAESSVHPCVPARWLEDFPGLMRAGKAGALMAGRAIRESMTLAGRMLARARLTLLQEG